MVSSAHQMKILCEPRSAFYGTVPARGEYHIATGYRLFMLRQTK